MMGLMVCVDAFRLVARSLRLVNSSGEHITPFVLVNGYNQCETAVNGRLIDGIHNANIVCIIFDDD